VLVVGGIIDVFQVKPLIFQVNLVKKMLKKITIKKFHTQIFYLSQPKKLIKPND